MSITIMHRISKTDCMKYKIPFCDAEESVKSLKERFLQWFETPKNPIELVFNCQILNDCQTLSECGIEPNVVLYTFTRHKPKEIPTPTISDEEILKVYQFLASIRNYPHNKMAALLKINRPENLNKILQEVPELNNDLRAIAFLEDPYLLTQIKVESTFRRMAQNHPSLIKALVFVMEMIKGNEKTAKTQKPGTSASMPSMSSLMAESDSDSSGSENFSVGFPAHRTNSESNSRITSNQLSAALAFASNTSNSNTPTNSVPTTSSSSSSLIRSPSSIITSSMFSNALRNAMRQVRDTNRVTPSNQTENRNENSNLAIQLNRMRELGLTDDAINLQALVICNNDVQAAINLVLSGAIGNTD